MSFAGSDTTAPSFYGSLEDLVTKLIPDSTQNSLIPNADLKVKCVKLLIGGSGSWMDETAYVDDIKFNGDIYNLEKLFRIDTILPTVTIGVSDTMITEHDVGGTFEVKATFSEAMDTAYIPTFSFDQNVDSTLKNPNYAWSVGDTVYTATYTVADDNVEEAGVDVSVSGAQDMAGNLQIPDPTTEADLFDVDTLHSIMEPYSIEVKANDEDPLTTTVVDDVKLVATVWNYFDELIPDGVEVSFTTNLGTIDPLIVPTVGGSAETSISSTDIGIANVIATAGSVSDSCTITFVEQTLPIELSLGWNLVSVPRTLADPAIEKVFAGITTIEKVYTYNGVWQYAFFEGGILQPDNTLTEIVDGKGYWVYTSEPKTITIKLKPLEYMATPPSYPLPAEWSLIGYTSIQLDESMPIATYLGYLKWNTLYRFEPGTGLEIAKPDFYRSFRIFELGRGYWIHLNEAGTLVP